MNTPFIIGKINLSDNIKPQHHTNRGLYIAYDVVVFEDGKFSEPASINIYKSAAGTYYVCVWIKHGVIHGSGSARCTKGYSYIAQFVKEALKNAGIEFENQFSGMSGEFCIENSLTAIAKTMGFTNFYIKTTK